MLLVGETSQMLQRILTGGGNGKDATQVMPDEFVFHRGDGIHVELGPRVEPGSEPGSCQSDSVGKQPVRRKEYV